MHHLSCFTLDDLQSGPLSQIWTQRTLRQFLRHPLRRPDSAPKLRRRYALSSAHPQSQKAWNWRSLQTLFLDELMRKALLLLYYDLRDLFPCALVVDTRSLSSGNKSKLIPIVIITVALQQGDTFNRPLVALIDSGSDCSHIQRRVLPDGVTPGVIHRPLVVIFSLRWD
jgi:hypothetical protein